jgi:MFS transporter, DHA3 family, macrolide efflux protein
MMSEGFLAPVLGGLFGTEKDSGIALLYVICALAVLLIGLSGYVVRRLRDVELMTPDRDH